MAAKMMTALLNTLMGMGTVFIVLIFISLVISLFKYIPEIQVRLNNRKQRKNEAERQEALEKTKTAPKRPILEEEENEELVYDGELAAVIMAAILASAGGTMSADRLVVRSIKRVKTKNRR